MLELSPKITALIEKHKDAHSGSCQKLCADISETLGYDRPTQWEQFWNDLQKLGWEHARSWVEDNGGILLATAEHWFGKLPGFYAEISPEIVHPQSVIIVNGTWVIKRSDGSMIEWATSMNLCSYFIVGNKGEFYFGGHGEGLVQVIESNIDIYMLYNLIPNTK